MADKLKKLLDRCKCSIYLTINQHRNYYDSAAKGLEWYQNRECPPDLTPEIEAKIIETDTIINLHFYPDSPNGFYQILHYDLDAALDVALKILAK